MSDVEIYRRVNGRKLEKFMAVNPAVQRTLDVTAIRAARRAEALLQVRSKNRRGEDLWGKGPTGRVSVEVDKGKVDTWVILEARDAMAIEFGRGPIVRKDGTIIGPAEGLHVLRDAFKE